MASGSACTPAPSPTTAPSIATGGKFKTGFMSKIAVARFSVLTDAGIAALKLYLDSR